MCVCVFFFLRRIGQDNKDSNSPRFLFAHVNLAPRQNLECGWTQKTGGLHSFYNSAVVCKEPSNNRPRTGGGRRDTVTRTYVLHRGCAQRCVRMVPSQVRRNQRRVPAWCARRGHRVQLELLCCLVRGTYPTRPLVWAAAAEVVVAWWRSCE